MEKRQLEEHLSVAMEQQQFQLYYQPKLDLITGEIEGVEALIRWIHPKQGMIPPLTFIPMAEESGLILSIGEWVLKTACKQMKAWQEKGMPEMGMAVNLSASQLYQTDLVNKVQSVLEETGVAPHLLEFEITESMTMDVGHVLPVLYRLKNIGVNISMDDFGTGYSSLYHLKEFPIDNIKIDQSFVRHCITNPKNATLVKTIIAMAHQLNLKAIAEGVETKEHLSFLQRNLCDKVQGYLFSKPVPAEELEENFADIESIIRDEGLSPEFCRKKWLAETLEKSYQELQDTVREQKGVIFKFEKYKCKFIHTVCDGALLYRMNLTPGQIIGRELHDFLPDDKVNDILPYYRRAWNGESNITFEWKLNDIWYTCSLRPIYNGEEVTEVVGSCQDITDRKNKEETLKTRECNYRLIVENLQELIMVVNIKGEIEYVSSLHEEVLGFLPSFFQGKLLFGFIHPKDRNRVHSDFIRSIIMDSPFKVTFRFKKADGGWIFVESIGKFTLDKEKDVGKVVMVSRNISD